MTFFSPWHTFLLSLFGFITLIFLIWFKWISSNFKIKKNLPPSPPKFPVIGNFHQLGSSPRRSLQALSKKYGPLMLIYLGSIPTLVVSSAEVAQEILKTHDLTFSNRPYLAIPNILFYGSKDIAFSPYGEQWRQLKSIVVLHLLSNARVKLFRLVREEEIGLMIGALGGSYGSSVDLSALLASVVNNIICKVAFGKAYHRLGFRELLKKFVDILGVFCVGSYIPWLSWIDRLSGLNGRAHKVAKEFDDFLEGVLEEHLNQKKGEGFDNEEGQNFVDILRDIQINNTTGFILDTDTLKAIILDIFVAGIDTIYTSLDWVISELIRHPRVMKKLQQEETEVAQGRSMIHEEDLEKMKYLKAVIKESLRLHAPLPLLVSRESTQEVNLMGYDIPARTQVLVNAWAIARDPMLWEEPEEFRPERFLNNYIDYKGLHFEWLPFGGGRRGCPGLQFAVPIIELALANVVYKFNLALPNGVQEKDLDMTESNGITVQRKSPLLVVASPRF